MGTSGPTRRPAVSGHRLGPSSTRISRLRGWKTCVWWSFDGPCRSVSRLLYPGPMLGAMTISLGSRLPGTSNDLPGGQARRTTSSLLFGLSPGGVCRAPMSPPEPVRSYRTFSPLPFDKLRAVSFLLHFPYPEGHPAGRWALPTTVSCGGRTFLDPDESGPRSSGRQGPT